MTNYKELVQEHLESADHLAKKHVHPRLMTMLEAGGMNVAFNRAQGQYLYDGNENQYLDLLAGGGVFFLGRNNPTVHQAVIDVLSLNVPNLVVTNASILGGLVAERLLKLGGPNFSKVIYANSGAEATEVTIRFARYATRKRRFLALEGGFHGRTYGAISLCGFEQMKVGMDPIMPTVTPIRPNDIAQLRRELSRNDVAGVIMEPVQGMTCTVLSIDYMREAELLCDEFGAILIADEVQTGLGRTGEWFATTGNGIRPGMVTVSKTLSGGVAPVSAVMMREDVYERVFDKFTSGPIYFSTFAENNASMAASLATIDALEKLRAPQKAEKLAKKFRDGLSELQGKYDVIDRIEGKGLMMAIYFKESDKLALKFQQKLLGAGDPGAFGAAVNVDMFTRQRIMVQLPGPAANAIKILPPVICTDDDVEYFLAALEDTLARYYDPKGSPIASISRGVVNQAVKSASKLIPASLIPPILNKAVQPPDVSLIAQENAAASKKKKASRHEGIFEFDDYSGDITDHADVIIVGSGAGGGVLAEQLAAKGKKVLVIEAGPYVRPEEFRRDMAHTFSSYFWEGGMRALRGNAMLPTMQARCLGGTTVFNSAICMRPSEHALDIWAREEGVEGHSLEDLMPHLEAVEEIMHIVPTRPEIQGRRNELFREGLSALGWEGEAIRRNENGCQGSAGCLYGCKNGAKVSTEQCVERAVGNGAVVYTSITIDNLVMVGDRARGVEGTVRDPKTLKRMHKAHFTAKDCVVLAAGVMATPQIMQRSGLKHKGIGANLRVHPSLYAIGTFEETVTPWTGATQGWHCTEFLKSGIKLESLWADAGVLSEKFPSNPDQFQRYLKNYAQSAAWAGWVSGDDSVGSVRAMPGGRADFVFNLGDGDVRRLQEANAKLAELFLAAGAKEVFTGINGAPEAIRSERDIKRIRTAKFSATDLPSGSNHVFGTSAMGGDKHKHVTDSSGAVYAAQDLFVCDTGLFPRTPGVNPQETIMALAHRMGETLAARY